MKILKSKCKEDVLKISIRISTKTKEKGKEINKYHKNDLHIIMQK